MKSNKDPIDSGIYWLGNLIDILPFIVAIGIAISLFFIINDPWLDSCESNAYRKHERCIQSHWATNKECEDTLKYRLSNCKEQ
jgi:hypothetical protein